MVMMNLKNIAVNDEGKLIGGHIEKWVDAIALMYESQVGWIEFISKEYGNERLIDAEIELKSGYWSDVEKYRSHAQMGSGGGMISKRCSRT
jgi:hypothetical protein